MAEITLSPASRSALAEHPPSIRRRRKSLYFIRTYYLKMHRYSPSFVPLSKCIMRTSIIIIICHRNIMRDLFEIWYFTYLSRASATRVRDIAWKIKLFLVYFVWNLNLGDTFWEFYTSAGKHWNIFTSDRSKTQILYSICFIVPDSSRRLRNEVITKASSLRGKATIFPQALQENQISLP